MDAVYLDNNATTQPTDEVIEAVAAALRADWANPSSAHRAGQRVRQKLELARKSVGDLIGARPGEILFTSGGTESDNLALRGSLLDGPSDQPAVLVTTKIEHSAVREPAQWLSEHGVVCDYLPVDSSGVVQADALEPILAEHAKQGSRVVVSIQWANNETGTIQPVMRIGDICNTFGRAVRFHVDATQAVGKLPVDVKAVGADLLTLAAHKFHGPKGVGALYCRTGVRVRPQVLGGPQENERRGGTENVPGILGMAVAAEQAAEFVGNKRRIEELGQLRDRLETEICQALPQTVVNGLGLAELGGRLWNTTNLGFEKLEAEAILLGLSERGIYASAGAACSSGSLDPSPVLGAMGIKDRVAHGSIRLSLGRFTTAAQIDQAVRAVVEVVGRVGRTMTV